MSYFKMLLDCQVEWFINAAWTVKWNGSSNPSLPVKWNGSSNPAWIAK